MGTRSRYTGRKPGRPHWVNWRGKGLRGDRQPTYDPFFVPPWFLVCPKRRRKRR